ncbi:hypothetical protein OtV6_060 [Ostreococcus tauri virus RT-2011]|nr:hypothetical protein OtV6_060 [Ostreococcus tauri virus RT-2011]
MKSLSSFLGPLSNQTEKTIRSQPILFTLIILYQGLFSGNAIKIPENLRNLFNNKVFRFASLMLIAFSATQDIEYALISTTIFLAVMYAIKTPEERKTQGFI